MATSLPTKHLAMGAFFVCDSVVKCGTLSHSFFGYSFTIPLPLHSRCWMGVSSIQREGAGQTKVILTHSPESPNKHNHKMTKIDLEEIANIVASNTKFCTKEVLTSDEAARYMGISKSYLYKLTMKSQIPHYKPMGKICYFNRVELQEWLQQNRCATKAEIEQKAQNFCLKKGGAR